MSTLQVTNIKKTGETASRDVSGVAAAWVNLNGTGTVAIRDSANVSSLTDIDVGKYSTAFTSSFSSISFAQSGTASNGDAAGSAVVVYAPNIAVRTTSSSGCIFVPTIAAYSGVDDPDVTSAFHGGLS